MGTTPASSRPAQPWRRRLRALVVVGVGLPGLLGEAASAQEPAPSRPDAGALLETLALAPDQPASPDDVFVAVVDADRLVRDAGIARLTADSRASAAAADSRRADGARDVALVREAGAAEVKRRAAQELTTERDRLSDLTVRAYVTGGVVDLEKYREVIEGDTSDPAAGQSIMFGQVLARQDEVTTGARRDLATTKRHLAAASRRSVAAQHDAHDRDATELARSSEANAARDAYGRAVAGAADARRELQAAGRRVTTAVPEGSAIIGLPRLSAEDLAGWFATTRYAPRVATPMAYYAHWFIEEGRAEGIRGDIAFAQAVLETGGFTNTDSVVANNLSGIGHCDLCPAGWTFATPQLGVRAQIQLLKSYAVRKPTYANPLVDRRLRGPAGCCETWGDLTTVWATDPLYGPKVMLIYTDLVQHALDRRTAGLGLESTTTAAPGTP